MDMSPLLGLGDLRYPVLSPDWLEASDAQRDHWVALVSAQDKLAGHVLRLIRHKRCTLGELEMQLHHGYTGNPTQREIERAIRFLQDKYLVSYTLGKVVLAAPALEVPPHDTTVDAPSVVLDTSLQHLQRTWTRFIDLLLVAGWRVLDKLVWQLDKRLNPEKPAAKLPEPALPAAAPAPAIPPSAPEPPPANVSALPTGAARIPRRPSPAGQPLKPGTITRHSLRAISQKIPALRKGKLGDESFLLDQPAKPTEKTA